MKKSIGYISLSLLLCLALLFVGCGNTARSLAKNLDNTVTNLIYSVSSLDWADSSTLSNISGNTNSSYDSSLNYFNDFTFLNEDDITNNYSNIDPEIISNTTNDNLTNNTDNITNTNDTVTDINTPSNGDNDSTTPINHHYRFDRYNRRHPNNYNRDDLTRNRRSIYNNNRNQTGLETENNFVDRESNIDTNNMSGLNRNRTRFSNNTVSSIKNDETLTNQTTPIKMVNYSTSGIEESSSRIQDKITELLDRRAKILLYINDLYKGYVNLTDSTVTAINAYANIIKDNTSYLNQNKGMIINQLTRANNLVSTDANSPLINAYIIRTNEAIETRLTKLDSSILAIDSICNIIEANLTSKSPNFNAENNVNNNNTDINLSTRTLNNTKLITENNNANLNNSNRNLNKNSAQNRNNLTRTNRINNSDRANNNNTLINTNNISDNSASNTLNNQANNISNSLTKNRNLDTNNLNNNTQNTENLNNTTTKNNAISNQLNNNNLNTRNNPNNNIINNTTNNSTLNRFSNNTDAQILSEDTTYNNANKICKDCEQCKNLTSCEDCENCRIVNDCSECKEGEVCVECNPGDPNSKKICVPESELSKTLNTTNNLVNNTNDNNLKTINNSINNALKDSNKNENNTNKINNENKESDLVKSNVNNNLKSINNNIETAKDIEIRTDNISNNVKKIDNATKDSNETLNDNNEKTVKTFASFLDKKHREKEEARLKTSNTNNAGYVININEHIQNVPYVND